jgi:hypothetical protein
VYIKKEYEKKKKEEEDKKRIEAIKRGRKL